MMIYLASPHTVGDIVACNIGVNMDFSMHWVVDTIGAFLHDRKGFTKHDYMYSVNKSYQLCTALF
jgi:hypothetical protein